MAGDFPASVHDQHPVVAVTEVCPLCFRNEAFSDGYRMGLRHAVEKIEFRVPPSPQMRRALEDVRRLDRP